MQNAPDTEAIERIASPAERWSTLRDFEEWVRAPMLVLSFLWLVLVLIELVHGASGLLEVFGLAIWVAFVAEFGLRLLLAPARTEFLRNNWISIIALAVPALRLARTVPLIRAGRAVRGLRLVKIVGTANRSMNALRQSLGRRGVGYVLAATVLVALLGAGGMLSFESAAEVEGGFRDYADALWWTGMILTSMGSAYWPRTEEGRLLCFLLSLYGLTVFGYLTARLIEREG